MEDKGPSTQRKREGRNQLLPWIVLLLAALAMLYFLNRGCSGRQSLPSDSVPTPLNGHISDTAVLQEAGEISSVPPSKTPDVALSFSKEFAAALDQGDVDPNTVFILDEVKFEEKTDKLLPSSHAQLDRLAALLKKYREVHIRVESHTDNTGNVRQNLDLTVERAKAVRSHLQDEGVAASRIALAGRGQYKPLAPNTTEEGRRTNNRIEVFIVPAPQ